MSGRRPPSPLADADEAFRQPFEDRGEDVDHIFYFGESVLLAPYRGQGTGRRFFEIREAAARAWGAAMSCFCAVERPKDHPLQPHGYRPNDAFWKRLGYTPQPELRCRFSWTQIDTDEETENTLNFWLKHWDG